MGKIKTYTTEEVQNITATFNSAVQNKNLYHVSFSTEEFNSFMKENCKGLPYSAKSYISFFLAENSENNTYIERDETLVVGKGSKKNYYKFVKPIPWRVMFHVIQQIQKCNKYYTTNKRNKTSKSTASYRVDDIVTYLTSKGCTVKAPEEKTFSSKREGIEALINKGYIIEKSVTMKMDLSHINDLI